MARHGKRYADMTAQLDREQLYEPLDAVKRIKEMASAKFDETVDVAFRLSVDVRHADQMVRGAVVLPHGTGKEMRVLVFAKGEKEKEALDAGADHVGAEELAERIEKGWLEFDQAIATPDMMGVVGRLGRILGPRGLMPNPRSGTVTFDVAQAVNEAKGGRVEYRTDRMGIVHTVIGKASFTEEQLLENLNTIADALIKARPAAAKGQYMRSVSLSSTMGPSLKINPRSFVAS